ncbi:MAG: nuclease-related domain-containing protein [Woeseiaceae bacterium]
MTPDESKAFLLAAFRQPSLDYWPVYLATLIVLGLLAGIVLWWVSRRKSGGLEATLEDISLARLRSVVLPKADDGEIHIDHILLTQRGILVVDAKDIRGIVFGGDRMHDWTVMDAGRRYTIPNPQAALFDRVAAVKLAVSDIPVEGRILFGGEADFSKGIPTHVCSEQQLREEWLPDSRSAGSAKAAFDTAWQTLRDATFG